MAGPLARLYATLGLDATGFDKGLKKAETTASKFQKGVVQGLGLGAGLGVASAAAAGIGMVTDAIGTAIDAASDFEEANSKVGVVFEGMSEDVRAFAKTSAESMGISEAAALDALGTFGNFTQALGLSEAASADLSKEMVQLAADIGSFNNVASDEVLLALRSGLSGEAEPMRRFGVALSAAAVDAKLLAQGIQKVDGAYTEAQKVQARYQLIMEQTSKAQGDFARTSDSLANSQRTLSSNITNAMAGFGAVLTPVLADLTSLAAEVIPGVIVAFDDLRRLLDPGSAALEDQGRLIRKLSESYGLSADRVLEFAESRRQAGKVTAQAAADEEQIAAALDTFANLIGVVGTATAEQQQALADYEKTLRGTYEATRQATDGMSEHEKAARGVIEAYRDTLLTSPVVPGSLGAAFARDWVDRFMEPLETVHDEAPEEVKQTFADIRAEIKAGFGSVKEALEGPSGIVDPGTRIRNMGNRLREATANLAKARQVNDPFSIAKWEAAVAKQRLNLETYKRQTRGNFDEVKRDSTRKAATTTDGVVKEAERMVRQVGRLSLYDAGVGLVQSWRDGITAGFAAGMPSMSTLPRMAGAGVGGPTINIYGNVYGGDPGLRQLGREIQRATRLQSRERG